MPQTQKVATCPQNDQPGTPPLASGIENPLVIGPRLQALKPASSTIGTRRTETTSEGRTRRPPANGMRCGTVRVRDATKTCVKSAVASGSSARQRMYSEPHPGL